MSDDGTAGWVTVHRGELSLSVIEEVIRGHDPAEAASILYWRIFQEITGANHFSVQAARTTADEETP